MNERQVKSQNVNSMSIPVEFGTGLPFSFPIKVQPNPLMNASAILEKPLIPGLFQIAACADDARSVSALKSALASQRLPLSDMMLDPEKLEALLKNIAEKKKAALRRASIQRLEKSLA